jgi:hypothetical protein
MRLTNLFEEEQVSVHWVPPKAARGALNDGEEAIIWVDVAKVDADWSKDRNFYVGPHGTGAAIGGRYARFGEWLSGGDPVEMSELGFDSYDRPFFSNGRHRFSWMRDHGANAVPVITDADRAQEFFAKYGSSQRKTVITEAKLSKKRKLFVQPDGKMAPGDFRGFAKK